MFFSLNTNHWPPLLTCLKTKHNAMAVFAGGAISNLYAVAVARHTVLPDAKAKGLSAMPRLVMFTSEHVRSCSCLLLRMFKNVL